MNLTAIVPIKEFDKAKSRLSSILPHHLRKELVKNMLKDVLRALTNANEVKDVIIVTPSKEIHNVTSLFSKVHIVYDEGKGQIPAVMKAMQFALDFIKPDAILLTVADIPLIRPQDINEAAKLAKPYNTIVLAPSIDGGTNIMVQHPPRLIELMYGENSFYKHLKLARSKNINVRIYRSNTVILDVTDINDLSN